MKYGFYDLADIIKKLREPGGCPWDREQTHQSLKKHLIEEAYEAFDAISGEDAGKMADELGDVLLQIVLHAEIGREAGTFDIDDVTGAICRKMITRHPHVFGDISVDGADGVARNWEEIKKRERGQSRLFESMENITRALPNLSRARKIQQKASEVGFDWQNAREVLEKVEEELDELKAAIAHNGNVSEEIGDLLFSIVNLSRFLNVDCEEEIGCASNKFIKRFKFIEENACKTGRKLVELSLLEMDELWEAAKRET